MAENSAEQDGAFQVGKVIVRPDENAVERGGRVIRIEPRVMDLLLLLSGRAGRIVTRDEIMDSVWSGMTVSDDVLAQAISKLRHALGDDRRNPRYIETVYKRGYRLLAPVRYGAGAEKGKIPGSVFQGYVNWLLPGVILVLMTIIFLQQSPGLFTGTGPEVAGLMQLTSHPDNESFPALSPDGGRIVFTREGAAGNGLFLLNVGEALPHRLTSAPGRDLRAQWSPDGQSIRFLRLADGTCWVMRLLLATGTLEEEAECTAGLYPDMAVQGDGEVLAIGRPVREADPMAIHVKAGDGPWSVLSTPPEPAWGDFDPIFSPDGGRIAFTRAVSEAMHDIYILDRASGNERRITDFSRNILGHAWFDENRLIAAMRAAGTYGLWLVDTDTGARRPLFQGAGNYQYPGLSGNGDHLVTVRRDENTDIYRGGLAGGDPAPVITSNGLETDMAVSPDGAQLAFVSNRGQGYELWLANADGTEARQVTQLGASLISTPAWHENGDLLAFAVREGDRADIYTYQPAGGRLEQVISDGSANLSPVFTPGRDEILFASNRSGDWGFYTYNLESGEAHSIPAAGPVARAMVYGENRRIVFSRFDEAGLFLLPGGGAEPERLTDRLGVGDWANWRVVGNRILFLDRAAEQIAAFDLETGEITGLAPLPFPLKSWDKTVSFSPDGQSYFAAFLVRSSSDLYLMELE